MTNEHEYIADYYQLFNIATNLLAKADFSGFFTELNSSCESILGWTQEEMMSRPWLDFVHPEDVAMTQLEFDKLVDGNTSLRFENRYRCKDGGYRWLRWKTRTVLSEQTIYCSASDITETRRLHSITQGQKVALEMYMHGSHLPDILDRLVQTMEENSTNKVRASILLVSEDQKHLVTGSSPNLPDAYNKGVHGIEIGLGQGSCGTSAATGEVYVAQDIATDPSWIDFREIALEHNLRACWSNPILSSKGEVFGTFAMYYDRPTYPLDHEIELVEIISRTAGIVIEREKTRLATLRFHEQLIQARNEAEAANVAKSEFLTKMSHEIRTPMNVVMGIADILKEHEDLSPSQGELVTVLQNSASCLLELIDDLLDISKIEEQRIELQRVTFSISRLLEEVSSMVAIQASQKDLDFEVTCDELTQDLMTGDRNRLRQVILNLCSNALKFTDTGRVAIHVSSSSDAISGAEQVVITVTDTGIGIAKDKLKSIFQKFTQADNSISRKFGGTGLGLTITKQLVKAMRGTLKVKSTLGQGSKFTITLPLSIDASGGATPAAVICDEPEAIRAPKKEMKILVVEDFAPNAIVATRYLKVFGYKSQVAKNGTEAVEMARHNSYFAILMDVQMPDISGFEATRLIREQERKTGSERTPIIAMTAHAMVGDRERCIEAGMDDYLSKPFDADELKRKLSSLVRGEAV